MTKHWTTCAAAALTVAFLSVPGARAGMTPAVPSAGSDVQRADCAVGFHLGPAGACIIGTPEHVEHDRVIERRSSDEGCETRTVRRTDPDGNSETRTASNCD